MVDLDNLVKVSNSGQFPDLMNSSDVDNIKELINAQSLDPAFDLGVIKTSPTKPSKYGVKVAVPTGIDQLELYDGSILQNKVFKYLVDNKSIYFEEGKPDIPVEEFLYFDDVPLFAPTIDALCELATTITGNSDTSKLKELLNLLEDVVPDNDDYALTTLILSKSNKSIKLGLNKIADQTVSTEVFKFLGKDLMLKINISDEKKTYIKNDYICLDLKNNTKINKEKIKKELELFYRSFSEKILKEKTLIESKKMNLKVKGIKVRSYKNRWGSCSSNGDISYNWKLIMAPDKIINYVIIHELCHLIYFNHSRDYWREVRKKLPNYRESKEWLKSNQYLFDW